MFTVTLIAGSTADRAIGAHLLEDLRRQWSGGTATWLDPHVAAEFEIAAPAEDFERGWDRARQGGYDLAVQPSAGRRKSLLIADMDSTMIGQECIDELAAEAGVGAQVAAITARAMNGELDFEGALKERVALLKGLDATVIERVLAERITYTPGGATLISTMKAHGAYAALVSGGFTDFAERVAAQLGFDESRANRLHVAAGKLTGTVEEPILGRDAKVRALDELSARLGIEPDAAIAVGDGANDLGMLQRAGAGVALHAKPVVAAQCELRINFGDLTSLLYLQGYHRDEFAAAA